MTIRRVALIVMAVLLATTAFAGLLPFTALPLLARLSGCDPIGVGMDVKAQVLFAAIGGAAALGSVGLWLRASAFGIENCIK